MEVKILSVKKKEKKYEAQIEMDDKTYEHILDVSNKFKLKPNEVILASLYKYFDILAT